MDAWANKLRAGDAGYASLFIVSQVFGTPDAGR